MQHVGRHTHIWIPPYTVLVNWHLSHKIDLDRMYGNVYVRKHAVK